VYLYSSTYAQVRILTTTSTSVHGLGTSLAAGPVNGSTATILAGAPSSSPLGVAGAGSLLRFNVTGNLVLRIDGTKYGELGWASVGSAAGIFVGSPFATDNGSAEAGDAFLYSATGQLQWKIAGTKPKQFVGYAVAGGVDLDGTTGVEWVSGAPGVDVVYVLSASGGLWKTITTYMPSAPHFFGAYIATPGDTNGDQHADLVVGVTRSSNVDSGIYYGPLSQQRMGLQAAAASTSIIPLGLESVGDEPLSLDCEVYDCEAY
jgi:hypothetical protein